MNVKKKEIKIKVMKYEMLEEWSKNKRAPHHTQFLHANELEHSTSYAKADA